MATGQGATARPSGVEVTGVHQYDAWQRREMPHVELLRTDLWSIPLPMPESPLRYVSVYALAGPGGLTLIDAGWGSDEAWTALKSGLATFGADVSDIRACLVTHLHYDHIGLAGRIREASDAWIALHPADQEVLADPAFREPHRALPADIDWLVSLGAPRDEAARMRSSSPAYARRAEIVMPDRLIEGGTSVTVRGWQLRALHTPGHTPGHLCFVDERTHDLFGGDSLLPRITPSIGAYRHGGDALGDFLASLDTMAAAGLEHVLPAHEWRFRGVDTRTAEIRDHHRDRLREVVEAVRDHPGDVPWRLAARLHWSRPWSEYDGMLRIQAVAETAAHLVHLCRLGVVAATDEPVPRYQLPAGPPNTGPPNTRTPER